MNKESILDLYNSKKVVIFGTKRVAEVGDNFIRCNFFCIGESKIIGFCDNNLENQGKKLKNKKIYAIQDVVSMDNIVVIIAIATSKYRQEVTLQMENLGIPFFAYEQLLIAQNEEKIREVYEMFEGTSKLIYKDVVEAFYYNMPEKTVKHFSHRQYFEYPQFATPNAHEVFIDCGAYVGDTLENYLNIKLPPKKAYLFEPGEKQFIAMKKRVKRLVEEWAMEESQIECINAGVGEENYTANLCDSVTLFSNYIKKDVESNEGVKIYALDKYFNTENITFIKADVEGYEINMLKGAERIIREQKPKLAISIYHNPEDIFEIPLLIKRMVPEYKFEIGVHTTILDDILLYAYVE